MSDALFDLPEPAPKPETAYRVLARKYRPLNFDELIGQDALVRTLSNAFATARVAHAFMLTGVRGVGKTTTARIIAKGLNCVEGPTVTPCGKCDACVSITDGRNVDVLEMDAASRTGVDDIRDIIEGVKYAPTSVRTKVYIIDEVHMLSRNAFNALLKTLEEPPPHVKFIFATTEIRKVPVTVLSRCQRYDLRRIDAGLLIDHFAKVSKAEGIEVDDEALRLLARAADGSARDGLTLLDQAIARGGTVVTGEQVREMLGLADRSQVFDLLLSTLTGKAGEAIDLLSTLHKSGAEPLTLLQDMLDGIHQLSRHKTLPERKGDVTLTAAEATRMAELSVALSMPVLARGWQILLKGVSEVQNAPQPMPALEMLLIRLSHIGTLPTPDDLIRKINEAGLQNVTSAAPASVPAPSSGGSSMRAAVGMNVPVSAISQPQAQSAVQIADWRSAVALFAEKREMQLYAQLMQGVECISFAPGHLELFLRPGIAQNTAPRIATLLQEWTGSRWMVSLAKASRTTTLAEDDNALAQALLNEAAAHPMVSAILLAFPGAKIDAVREKVHALPEGAEADLTLHEDNEDE